MSGSRRTSALLPTGSQLKTYGCMRSLARRGVHTVVASEEPDIPHFASRYCSERVELPSPATDLLGYRDALLRLARRDDVRTILPVREHDTYLFAKHAELFAPHVSLAAPTADSLRRAHDRLQLAREAAAAGVPYAETRLLSEVDTWDRDVVVKSRFNLLTSDYVDSVAPSRATEVKNVTTLAAGEAPDAAALRETMGHDPIVQDFVPQAEKFLYTALWDDGEPVATYQHRQLRQNSWVGGGGIYRESAYSEAVDDAATRLLEHLDWHGLVCIEYVRDAETDEWTFLEINPRVWQSIPEAVRAGVDFPYYYWLQSQGRVDEVESSYETGVACHNAYGELRYLLSLLRDDSPLIDRPSLLHSFWDVVSSTVTNPRFEYLRRDDPGLALRSARQLLSAGVTDSRSYG